MSDPIITCMRPHLPHHRVTAYDQATGTRAESDTGLTLAQARRQAVERLEGMIRSAGADREAEA